MAKNTNPHAQTIKQLLLEGVNMAEVGRQFNLSKQRIKQMADKWNISVIPIRRKKKEQEYFLKWGNRDTSDLYASCREKFRRKKANSKGQEWTVQFGELDFPPTCPILGLELDYFAEKTQENSPSFDRIDPLKGYITGNVQIISWRANRIKNDGTSSEHMKIAEYLKSLQE